MQKIKEMRKYIDSFKEFVEKNKKMEVLVSYDCSDIYDPFPKRLRELLKEYDSEEITQSNYKIGRVLSCPEIDKLKDKIIKEFKKAVSINEGKGQKKTIVKIITPMENQFVIDVVIDKMK